MGDPAGLLKGQKEHLISMGYRRRSCVPVRGKKGEKNSRVASSVHN